jgi:hypothetical protein
MVPVPSAIDPGDEPANGEIDDECDKYGDNKSMATRIEIGGYTERSHKRNGHLAPVHTGQYQSKSN